MPNRSEAKWLPFNSVCNSKKMINDLTLERSKITKPSLTEEQKSYIEDALIDSFYEDIKLNIYYYKSGYIYKISKKIKKIDTVYHKIYFDNITLLFDQIVKVSKCF